MIVDTVQSTETGGVFIPGISPVDASLNMSPRGTLADLQNCYRYCQDKWPGDAQCIADCKSMVNAGIAPGTDGRPIASAADPCRGGIDRYKNPCPVVRGIDRVAISDAATDLYNSYEDIIASGSRAYTDITGSDFGNTGINPGQTGTQNNAQPPINSADTSADNTTLYIVGGVAVVGLLIWMLA